MALSDATKGAILALFAIIVIAYARWHVRKNDFDGYWRGVGGAVHEIREMRDGSTGVRFEGTNAFVPGKTGILRTLKVDGKKGRLDLTGRHLVWGNETWIREGLFNCRSCN